MAVVARQPCRAPAPRRPPACVPAQLSTSPPPRPPAAGADTHEGQGANLPAGASDPEPLTAAQPPADASCARAVVAGGAASGQDGEPGTRGTVQVCSHSPFTPVAPVRTPSPGLGGAPAGGGARVRLAQLVAGATHVPRPSVPCGAGILSVPSNGQAVGPLDAACRTVSIGTRRDDRRGGGPSGGVAATRDLGGPDGDVPPAVSAAASEGTTRPCVLCEAPAMPCVPFPLCPNCYRSTQRTERGEF